MILVAALGKMDAVSCHEALVPPFAGGVLASGSGEQIPTDDALFARHLSQNGSHPLRIVILHKDPLLVYIRAPVAFTWLWNSVSENRRPKLSFVPKEIIKSWGRRSASRGT